MPTSPSVALAAANRASALFETPVTLSPRGHHFTATTKYGTKLWVRPAGSLYPTCRYGSLGLSGSEATAVSCLLLWVRGKPRLPLGWWQFTFRGNPHLAALVDSLTRDGYAADGMTACVFCRAGYVTDWWCRNRVEGPCCRDPRCRQTRGVPHSSVLAGPA